LEALSHGDRMLALAQIRAEYEHLNGHDFFPAPPPVSPIIRPVREVSSRDGRVSIVDATWPSPFVPYSFTIAERYLGHAENRTAAARLFLHRHHAPRPAIIIVHGYLCGQFGFEERVWPIGWLLDHGIDVALTVLPFHAVRAGRTRAHFPSSDPRVTNEGFLQATLDIRTLCAILRDRSASQVGLLGMSLGGYTTALLATVDASLACAVPIIPLASIADFARDDGRFVGTKEEQHLQHQALRAANRVVDPLARPLKLDPSRVLVVGAAADRVTPILHARRLADHFGATLETFDGGHLLQFWRARAFRSVGRLLARLGFFDR
jgi:pimeloyl-ACP methyl ester carboxylesterase